MAHQARVAAQPGITEQYNLKLKADDQAKIGDGNFVWVISPIEAETFEPVAAFKSFDVAAQLVHRFHHIIEEGVNLRPVLAEENKLEVGKFEALAAVGMTPYLITLDREGGLLEFDLFPEDLEETSVVNELEKVIKKMEQDRRPNATSYEITGTFWAPSPGFAIKKAKLFRKMLLSMAEDVIAENSTRKY